MLRKTFDRGNVSSFILLKSATLQYLSVLSDDVETAYYPQCQRAAIIK